MEASSSAATSIDRDDERSVLIADDGPVTTLTLNRPEKRNALSLSMMRELAGALRTASGRVVVLAAGGPAFSAGHDLRELVDRSYGSDVGVGGGVGARQEEIFVACIDLMAALHEIDQPVIAAVHGVATAAGCQLVAACDLALAETSARFGTPGVRIGLFCSTPMVPLSRAVGPKRSMQMLLTGDLIDASTAANWGLINEVVPDGTVLAAAHELAAKIAEASRSTVAIGKSAFYRQLGIPQPDAYELAKAAMLSCAATPDAQEGMRAFLYKRKPNWSRV